MKESKAKDFVIGVDTDQFDDGANGDNDQKPDNFTGLDAE